MQIRVASIRKNPGESITVERDLDMSNLFSDNDSYALKGPVNVFIKITNGGHYLTLEGMVRGTAEGQCNRCLEYFTVPVETKIYENYCHREDLEEGMEENKDLHIFEGEVINLTDDIRDSVLLHLPMKALCRDDCKGICPHCGQNLNQKHCDCTGENIDPRLDILKKLLPS